MSGTNGIADLLFVNGPVYTMDAARSWASAVAVKAGTIVAVGSDDDVRAWKGPHTEVVDLAGRMLIPGFQDAHVHPPGSGLEMLRCDLSEIYTLEEYQRIIADYAAANPDAPWILGGGWYMDVFPGGTPTKETLDARRARPAGCLDQPRRSRRMGQLARAGARRRHARHTRSPRRPDRTRRRRRAVRHAARRRDGARRRRVAPQPTPTRTTPPACGCAGATSTRWASPAGRTRSSGSTTATGRSTPTSRPPASGELTARVVGALWWDRASRRSTRSTDLVERRARARRPAASRRPA